MGWDGRGSGGACLLECQKQNSPYYMVSAMALTPPAPKNGFWLALRPRIKTRAGEERGRGWDGTGRGGGGVVLFFWWCIETYDKGYKIKMVIFVLRVRDRIRACYTWHNSGSI